MSARPRGRSAEPLLHAADAPATSASSAPIASSLEDSALLRAILDELRGLRSDLRRQPSAPALIAALDGWIGGARFTVAGVLEAAEEDRALADALADVVDMDASGRSRATALGTLLARLPEVEVAAQQRGCAVYRLRT